MTTESNVTVEKDALGWVVRVRDGGREQTFHCATEEMARQLTSVLSRSVRTRRALH